MSKGQRSPQPLPADPAQARNYREWRQEWLLAVARADLGKGPFAVATALCFHAWATTDKGHQVGTYTFGHEGIARVVGIAPDKGPEQRKKRVSEAMGKLKDAGYVQVTRPGSSTRHRNGTIKLTAPGPLIPVELVPEKEEPLVPEKEEHIVPNKMVPSPCEVRAEPVDTTYLHPYGNEDAEPAHSSNDHKTDTATDYEHFLRVVEPQKRWSLTTYAEQAGYEYNEALELFQDHCAYEESTNWIGKFRGVLAAESAIRNH